MTVDERQGVTGGAGPDRLVWTTTGPVALADLGRTLVHEHVLVVPPGGDLDPTALGRADILERAVDALAMLIDHDVRTVVDPCPIDQGRDVEMLAEVSVRSGIQVICATGFYLETDGRGIPYYWRRQPTEAIVDLFVAEIENGIGDTGIRPGVIKAATGLLLGDHERRVVTAAGRASAATGTPVVTHTEKSMHAETQLELLRSAGADLRRCLLGHLDNLDIPELMALARAGAMVGVDRIGWDTLGDEGHRVDLVSAMLEAGLGAKVCISQDRVATYLSPRPQFFVPEKSRAYVEKVHWPALQRDGTTKGFTYLFTHFIPRLEAAGVSASEIDKLLVDNPRRLFGDDS